MISHPAYALLLAALVSGASAILGNQTHRERACAAAYTFLSCLFTVIAGGWVMYWIHG